MEPVLARQPAVNVSWNNANGFCDWLGKVQAGRRFRLPTEAEYERAMRLAGASAFPWGDAEFEVGKPGVFGANYAELWKSLKERPRILPVRSYPSQLGLFDLSGNVWEWTADWYDPSFYSKAQRNDPLNDKATTSPQKVVRGGSCPDPLYMLENAYRGRTQPDSGQYNVGFRVVEEESAAPR